MMRLIAWLPLLAFCGQARGTGGQVDVPDSTEPRSYRRQPRPVALPLPWLEHAENGMAGVLEVR